MFKWIKKLFGNKQSQKVGSNSFGIQVGNNCTISNSFGGKNIKSDKSIEIKDDEVWIDGERIK